MKKCICKLCNKYNRKKCINCEGKGFYYVWEEKDDKKAFKLYQKYFPEDGMTKKEWDKMKLRALNGR